MGSVTPKQRKVLQYIEGFTARAGYSPTLEEIATGVGVTKATVQQYVQALEEKGMLARRRYSHRSIEIRGPQPAPSAGPELPLLGVIAAGRPIDVTEADEKIDFGQLLGLRMGRDYFVLKVEGQSMIEEGIFDGDYVVVEKRPTAEDGQTIVALLPDNTVTLKKLYREKNRVRLQPANAAMAPIYLDTVTIQGVVRGVFRPF